MVLFFFFLCDSVDLIFAAVCSLVREEKSERVQAKLDYGGDLRQGSRGGCQSVGSRLSDFSRRELRAAASAVHCTFEHEVKYHINRSIYILFIKKKGKKSEDEDRHRIREFACVDVHIIITPP